MNVALYYGDRQLTLQIPSANIAGFIQPAHQSQDTDNMTVLKQALSDNDQDLSRATSGQCVGILLPDGTRDLPIKESLSVLLARMRNARRFLFFICTGTHDADTPANQRIVECIREQANQSGISDVEIVVHDCEQSELAEAGVTSRQTLVRYHRRLDEPDMFVVLSDVKHHYFAGYSNPIKNFMPGLCAFETTEQNHSWTMDPRSAAGFHPWHPNESRRDNPLAADQLEAMQMIVADRPVRALVTISSEKQIQWARFGDVLEVTSQAFARADAQNAHAVRRVDYMVISPGGLPNDVDLYIAQRALELTASVLRDGGQLLFLAACPNGVGPARTYYQFFRPMTEPVETMKQLKQADYKLFSHKPVRFIRLIGRLKRFAMHSEMPSNLIRQMHMQPCEKPQELIDSWIENDPAAEIRVVDGANKLLLTPAD